MEIDINMVARLKKFWDNLETLEQKLFWIIQGVFIIVSVIGTILTVVENVNHAAEVVCLLNVVVCVLVALFVKKTASYSVAFFIVIFYYIFGWLPLFIIERRMMKRGGYISTSMSALGGLCLAVPVLAIEGGWAKVRYNGFTGWVHKNFISP